MQTSKLVAIICGYQNESKQASKQANSLTVNQGKLSLCLKNILTAFQQPIESAAARQTQHAMHMFYDGRISRTFENQKHRAVLSKTKCEPRCSKCVKVIANVYPGDPREI